MKNELYAAPRAKGLSVKHEYTCVMCVTIKVTVNPLTAKLLNLNFHPLEVVSR